MLQGRKKGHKVLSYGICPLITVTYDGALLFWRWLNICLPMKSSKWIPYFAFIIKLPLSQPIRFLTFTLSILLPISLQGSEQAAVWGSAAKVNPYPSNIHFTDSGCITQSLLQTWSLPRCRFPSTCQWVQFDICYHITCTYTHRELQFTRET